MSDRCDTRPVNEIKLQQGKLVFVSIQEGLISGYENMNLSAFLSLLVSELFLQTLAALVLKLVLNFKLNSQNREKTKRCQRKGN